MSSIGYRSSSPSRSGSGFDFQADVRRRTGNSDFDAVVHAQMHVTTMCAAKKKTYPLCSLLDVQKHRSS